MKPSRVVVPMLALALILVFADAGLPARRAPDSQPPIATPVAADQDPGSLVAMLGRVPDLTEPWHRPGVIATYSNPAAAYAGLGSTPPSDLAALRDDDFRLLPIVMDLAWNFGGFGVGDEWRAALGFDALLIDQALQVVVPDGWRIALLRGRFDAATLQAAWTRNYAIRLDVEGVTAYVSSLTDPAANVAARLADGTLVFASSVDDLRAVLAVAGGSAPGLASRSDVAALLRTMPADLAGALLLDGATLDRMPEAIDRMTDHSERIFPSLFDADAVATAVAEAGTMPPVRLALLATTPGQVAFGMRRGAGDATPVVEVSGPGSLASVEVALLFDDRDAAQTAAGVVAARLATFPTWWWWPTTYADIFWEQRVWPADGNPIVRLHLGGRVTWWRELYRNEDLLFLYW
jgi:hypothetical protein